MKIVVAPVDSGGCGAYRMAWPYLHLRSLGMNIEFVERTTDTELQSGDMLCVQRVESPEIVMFMKAQQASGVRVIMDFDDNFHTMNADNRFSQTHGNGKPITNTFTEAVKLCDAVTVSTPDLAEEYAKFARCTVIENAIDDDAFVNAAQDTPPRFRRLGQIRIGWAGSDTHSSDMALIAKPVSNILKANPKAKFVFFGQNHVRLFEKKLWPQLEMIAPLIPRQNSNNPEDARAFMFQYLKTLGALDLDIALAPLVSTTFNRCKSAAKILEYATAGFPIVASRFGPYKRYAEETPFETIKTASEPKEWERQIQSLMDSAEARVELAGNSRLHVMKSHLVSQRAEQRINLIQSLLPVAA